MEIQIFQAYFIVVLCGSNVCWFLSLAWGLIFLEVANSFKLHFGG